MAEPQSISSLFSDVLGSTDYAATQLEADRKLGEQLQTGSAATLFAPERARRLTKSLGGIVGADTRSPAEIKAEQTKKMVSKAMQSAMAQYPTSRALQLEAVAKELMANGMTAEASKFRDAAQASQLQEAKIYSEQAKGFASEQSGLKSQAEATTETVTRQGKIDKLAAEVASVNAQRMEREQGAKLTEEQITTEIMKRDPTVSKIEAEAAAASALNKLRISERTQVETLTPLKSEELKAKTAATRKGIEVDDTRIKLINAQVSTEEVTQRAKEQGITLDQARAELIESEILRYNAMTPIEIVKANTEIAKNKAQAELNRAKLADVGMTEFTRTLEQLDVSEEERQRLLKNYAEAKSMTGGVSGLSSKGLELKLGIVEQGIQLAEGASTAMNSAEQMIRLVPNLTTGVLADERSVVNKYLNVLGVGDEDRVVADQLFKVLRGGSVLEAAGSLKGALSDKDLKFLQETVADKTLNSRTIVEAFASLYYERYADQKIAEKMEMLLNQTDAQLKNTNITGYRDQLREYYRMEAKGLLPLPTQIGKE